MKKSTKIGVVLSSIMGIGTAMAALAGFKLDRVPDDVDDEPEKDNEEKSSDNDSSEEIDDEEIKEMAEADSDDTDDKE